MSGEDCKCGWVKLYHPRGPLVTLPVTGEPANFAAMLANVSAALDAGFTVNAPGLDDGESRFEVAAVVRRTKTNRDGSESPMIDLYEQANEFKTLTVYLDTEEELTAFQAASKLRITDIPLFPGSAAPKHGENKQTDKFFVVPPRQFGCIYSPNPKYDQAQAQAATQASPYKVAKRIFARWADQQPPAKTDAAPADNAPTDEQVIGTWRLLARRDPPAGEFTKFCSDHFKQVPQHLRDQVKEIIRSHAAAAGFVWNAESRRYEMPAMAGVR